MLRLRGLAVRYGPIQAVRGIDLDVHEHEIVALVAGPKLLLLDEPVAGMNADEAEALRVLLLALRDRGLTILLIEHDMPFVMNLCDRLHVLDFGTLIAAGEPGTVRRDPRVLDAYLGEDA